MIQTKITIRRVRFPLIKVSNNSWNANSGSNDTAGQAVKRIVGTLSRGNYIN